MRLTAAPTGRKKIAQGKEQGGSGVPPLNQPKQQRRDASATPGHESQNTPGAEGVKADGDLPAGWTEQRIEQLFAPLEDGRTLHQGWSPQCDKVPSPSEDIWGVLKTTSIQAGEFQPEHNKLLPSGLKPRPPIEVKEGDILITCAGPRVRCGVSCLVRQTRKRLMMSGKMYRFRVDADRTDPRYVEAFLQTERARLAIDKMKTGSSDSGLNLTHDRFRQLPIPVAPLPEQRRIVAEIEKQFTRLEAGVAALWRVQANLKRYRAAVLKAACEGKLVPTEAELSRSQPSTKNSQPPFETGEELLACILTERRKNWTGRGKYKEPTAPNTANLPPLPEGWTWSRIGHLFQCIVPNRDKPRTFTGEIPWITLPDFSHKTRIRISSSKIGLSKQEVEENRAKVIPAGCVVMSCIGRFGLAAKIDRDSVINQQLHAFIIPHFLPAEYFVYALRSQKAYMEKLATSTTIAYLNKDNCNSVPVPLPPLAEQTRIVAEVERRLSVVEELEAVVSANLQRAIRLRQSILQKAFLGGLT